MPRRSVKSVAAKFPTESIPEERVYCSSITHTRKAYKIPELNGSWMLYSEVTGFRITGCGACLKDGK